MSTSSISSNLFKTEKVLLKSGNFSNNITSNSLSQNIDLVLPNTNGNNGDYLSTNGSGITTWTTNLKILNLNSIGSIGGDPLQELFFTTSGTTSTFDNSKIYLDFIKNVTITRIDLVVLNTLTNTADFRVYLNGNTTPIHVITTAVTTSSTVTLNIPSGQYINISMFNNNTTTKDIVNVIVTYN